MAKWPQDTQAARNAFYGDPGKGEIAGHMVPVVPPFAMYYDGKRVKAIQFHKKAAPALLAALNEIWDYCQHDQAKIDAAGVSKYAGGYNHRFVRGSSTKWSNHAYAAAIDLNAAENGLYAKGNMPQFVIDAFCRQGWKWGGWYVGRKDPMHFEAVDNSGRQPKSPKPLFGVVAHLLDPGAPADEIELAPEELPAVVGKDEIDPILLSVQTDLKSMNFNPGVPSGLWGGMTAGAIAGFINDRSAFASPPATYDEYLEIQAPLLAAIARAKSETPPFTRPVTKARELGDAATVATVAPEVVPVKRNFLTAAWASLAAFLSAVWATISSYVTQAWDFVSGHKDSLPTDPGALSTAWSYIGKVPSAFWIFMAAAGLGFIAWNSFNSVRKITESVQSGARQ